MTDLIDEKDPIGEVAEALGIGGLVAPTADRVDMAAINEHLHILQAENARLNLELAHSDAELSASREMIRQRATPQEIPTMQNDADFWDTAYLAAISGGHSPQIAEGYANEAVKRRNDKRREKATGVAHLRPTCEHFPDGLPENQTCGKCHGVYQGQRP